MNKENEFFSNRMHAADDTLFVELYLLIYVYKS